VGPGPLGAGGGLWALGPLGAGGRRMAEGRGGIPTAAERGAAAARGTMGRVWGGVRCATRRLGPFGLLGSGRPKGFANSAQRRAASHAPAAHLHPSLHAWTIGARCGCSGASHPTTTLQALPKPSTSPCRASCTESKGVHTISFRVQSSGCRRQGCIT
jgi:hypothetical protein